MIDDELRKAYQRTSYIVEVPRAAQITLRIGEQSRALDQLLNERRVSHWAFITAFNPRSALLSEEENEARHQKLMQRALALNRETMPGRGEGDDGSWLAEKSLLIFDMSPAEARELGREFEQNAVVVGALGEPAELLLIFDQKE